MMLRTFNEWSALGYKIKKGSKSIWVNDVSMFSEKQVEKTIKPDFGSQWAGCTPNGFEEDKDLNRIYEQDGW